MTLGAHLLGIDGLSGLLTVCGNVSLVECYLGCILMSFGLHLGVLLTLRNSWLLIAFGIRSWLHELFVVFAKVYKFAIVFGSLYTSCPS